MRTRPLPAIVFASLVLGVSLLGSETGAGAATTCDRFAAPGGSDAAAGTIDSPLATAEALVRALAAGQTGCFRAGAYGFGVLNVDRPGITLAPYGSEAVTLNGDIKVLPAGSGSTIEGMKLDGATGTNQIGPRIYADGVTLRDNEITNRHTGICVTVTSFESGAPRDVVIERNRIHDCGRLPATNHDHGIYIAQAHGTIVRDNWIYSNADLGVHHYPDAQQSLITGNVIDSNGQGVTFSGDDSNTNCSNDNVVEGNVITDSRLRWNAYSGGQGRSCTGNVVRNNCVHALSGDYSAAGGIQPNSRSFEAAGNLVAGPGYVAPASGDYRLQSGSPCLAKYTGTMAAPAAAPPPPVAGKERVRVVLDVGKRRVRAGRRVRLRGAAMPVASDGRRVVIERRRYGRWRRAGKAYLRHGGRFKERVRAHGGRRVLRLRARIPGAGRSRVVRVRVRRR